MTRAFRVEIVTPERIAFSGEVESLRVPAHAGELGVLAGHAPLLCTLRQGAVLLRAGGGERRFAVSGGFMEVFGGKTILLADSAEAPEEIDRARAEKAVTRAGERLRKPGKDFDSARAEAALARALNRLRVAGPARALSGNSKGA